MTCQIVIVGGSFAGLSCAIHMMKHSTGQKVHIHLVEPSNYMEYNPSNLRSIVDPASHQNVMIHMDQLIINSSTDPKHFTRYQTRVISVADNNATLQDCTVLPYDYLVIAIGSKYADSLKPDDSFTVLDRQAQIVEKHRELEESELVTIVGAGLVGVELAAEVAIQYTDKPCRLITRNDTILPTLPSRAQRYARNFLLDHNVNLEDGQGKSVNNFVTSAASHEIVFDCTGVTPARFPIFKMGAGSDDLNSRAKTGFLSVNKFLQVLPRVFCIGDCCNDPYGSTKLAYTAELQGQITAKNILKLVKCGHECDLYPFPEHLSKVLPPPSVICCSLGPSDGVLCFNAIAVTGRVAAWMKWLIERSKVGQYRGELWSRCLWTVGEPATFFGNMLYQSIATCATHLQGLIRTQPQRQ